MQFINISNYNKWSK